MKRKWILLSIASLTLIVMFKWVLNDHTFALSHPTDTSLTFVTQTPNKIEANLLFYKQEPTFTLEAWIKPTGTPTVMYVIAGSATGNNLSAGLVLKRNLKVAIHDYATAKTDVDVAFSTTTLSLNQWYHVAAVYKNGEWGLYINGLLEATATFPLAAPTASYGNYLVMGSPSWNDNNEYGSERVFSGSIADVRVWNVARTTEELTAAKDSVLSGNEPGLIGYYKLDASTTGKLYDKSPRKNDATGQHFTSVYTVSSTPPADTSITYTLPAIAGMQNVVERNGVMINANAGTTFTDTGLTPDTPYTYVFYGKSTNGETERIVKTIRTINPPTSGLSFDGVDDVIEIPSNTGNNVSTSAITQEAWIRLSSYPLKAFINKEYQYEMQVTSGGLLEAAYKVSGINGWYWISSGYKVPLNTWTHVASTFDGDRVKFYINGVLVKDTENTQKGPLEPNANALRLAARDQDGDKKSDNFAQITLASVRIWNSVRTEQEIQTNMNEKLTGTISGLVAAYYPNSMTNGVVYDATGYANHGMVQGMSAGSVLTPGNVTTTSIPLTWNPVSGAGSYELKRDGNVVQNTSATSFTDTATEDEKHVYALTPKGVDGESKTYTVPIRTKHTNGLTLNGIDQYGEVDTNGYTYTGQAFSIESRIKPDVTFPTNIGRTEELILGWRGWHQGMVYDSLNQQVCLQMIYKKKSDNTYVQNRICTPLAAGTEAFVSATFNPATRNTKLYIDGVLKVDYVSVYSTSEYEFMSYPYYDAKLYMGFLAPNKYAFKGMIYETRWWNKTLSADEVKQNVFTDFSNGNPALLGYWRFYNFATQSVYDQTGNNRTMSIKNKTDPVLNGKITKRTNAVLDLAWDKIEPSETFTVEKNGTQVVANGTSSAYTASGLTESTDYAFTIQAKNQYGQSTKEAVNATTFATSPRLNNVPNDVTFAQTTLTGQQQIIKSTMTGTLDVSNFAGGIGWNVSVSASQITMKAGKQYTLPKGSLMLSSPANVTPTDGTTSAVPTILNGSYLIDDGNSYKLLSANSSSDVGAFSAAFPADALAVTLTPAYARIDQDAYPSAATSYESIVTWTVNVGP